VCSFVCHVANSLRHRVSRLNQSLSPYDAIGQLRDRYYLSLISFGTSALRASFRMGSIFGGSLIIEAPPAQVLQGSNFCGSEHTSPVKAKRASSCVQRRSAHRIRGTTLVVGTGGAVRPVTLCLSAQGPRWTDPTIAPAFDGLKYSRLSQGKFIDHSLLGSATLQVLDENPTSVSAHRKLSQRPALARVRAQIPLAPSTEMSRMTIYRPDARRSAGSRMFFCVRSQYRDGSV
jgi:hypothetical protein